VQPAEEQPGQRKPFLRFEVLTLAPYDRALIEPGMLTPGERAQVDAYHARVLSDVGPLVDAGVRRWLEGACAPL
jgi:Xaa-Pro aminopeptidase